MNRHAATVSVGHAQRAVVGLLTAAALLLPWRAIADSSLQSGARTARAGAIAHLDFRLVIPPVLALSVADALVPSGAVPRVSVMSNTRHVLLAATARVAADERSASARRGSAAAAAPQPPGPAAGDAADGARRAVLLSAGRGAVIVEEAACRLGEPHVVARSGTGRGQAIVDRRPVMCTVAMP